MELRKNWAVNQFAIKFRNLLWRRYNTRKDLNLRVKKTLRMSLMLGTFFFTRIKQKQAIK
jgi:hypothetical protein